MRSEKRGIRLRRAGDQLLLTVKRGGGLAREEQEVELGPEQFEALWPPTEGRRLSKRRHLIPHEGLEIELDVFEGELRGCCWRRSSSRASSGRKSSIP